MESRAPESKVAESKPPESRAADAPAFQSNQSFHFEPSRTSAPSSESGKTYTVWSSGSGGPSGGRDES
jgi:hypothetical protein